MSIKHDSNEAHIIIRIFRRFQTSIYMNIEENPKRGEKKMIDTRIMGVEETKISLCPFCDLLVMKH